MREENQHLKESLNNARIVQQSLGKQLEGVKLHINELIREHEEKIKKEKQKLTGMYQEALREEQGKLLWKDRELKELE